MPSSTSERVKKRRDALRAEGLRPVQLWLSDTRHEGFAEECRRQALVVAAADPADAALDGFAEEALSDVTDWT